MIWIFWKDEIWVGVVFVSFLGGAENEEGNSLYIFLVGFCVFTMSHVQETIKSPLNICGKRATDFESVMKPETAGCTRDEVFAPIHYLDSLNSSFQETLCFI